MTDPTGQTVAYHQNAVGWLDTLTHANTGDPVGARRDVYEYSTLGRVKAVINRQGQRTRTAYDSLGRVTSVTAASGRGQAFHYDPAGFWQADSNAEAIDTVKVDPVKRRTTQITIRHGRRYVVTDSADATGLLRRHTLADSADANVVLAVTYGYDSRFLLDTILVSGQRTLLRYNADGVLTTITWPTTTHDSVARTLTHVHRPATVTYSRSALNTAFGGLYTMDTLDRVQQRVAGDSLAGWVYTYDHHGWLTHYAHDAYGSVEACTPDSFHMDGQVCTTTGTTTVLDSASFTYDSVGNRTDRGATLIAGDRLTAVAGYTLAYDSAGHLTHKSAAGFDQHLYWNSLDELDSVVTNGAVVRFGYDAQGRRVRKTTSTQTLDYIYSGPQLTAVIDSATHARQQLYTYFPGLDAPHSVIEAGHTYYFIQELQGAGHILGLIDSTGTVRNRYGYGPWGALVDSSETVANVLRFTGREWDADTRLAYHRARYYDPLLGRFISEDPIGLAGGLNPYVYASDDPVNHTDPSGTTDDENDGSSGPPCHPWPDGSCSHLGGGNLTLGFAGDGCAGWFCADAVEQSLDEIAAEFFLEQEIQQLERQTVSQKCQVPVSPPGVDIMMNIAVAEHHFRELLWFREQVHNKGPWDYKQLGPQYQDFGNFNYGATGAAAGLPAFILLRAAGYAQERAHTSRPEFGGPFGGAPYGDDPIDQQAIKQGIAFYSALSSGACK